MTNSGSPVAAARVLGKESWLPTPEDAVIQKLRWSKSGRRSKDVDDVTNFLSVQQESLDWPYLESWCAKHGTLAQLHQLRDEVAKKMS